MNDMIRRIAESVGLDNARVALIRNVAAPKATDEELAQLLLLADRTGLDPLARQIYSIPRWNGKRMASTPQTGIDGYRLVADRTGNYAPGREPSYEVDPDGHLLSATAYVKKYAGGVWHEVAATAFWDEYVQTKKDGAPTAMWSRMPRLMLAKCAEALALRRAFPAELSGIYTAEEMGQADNEPVVIEVEVIEAAPEIINPPTCDECDGIIEGTDRQPDPHRIAAWTRKNMGRALCAACYALEGGE